MLSTVLKALAILAAIAALIYISMSVLAWRYQDRMAFPAPRSPLPNPESLGMPDGRRIAIVASDGVALQGWYLPPDPPPQDGRQAPGLIWFYGNMETIEGIAPVLRQFRPEGTGMLVLDYRGYGASAGEPTEEGVYRDAHAAWDYIANLPEIDSTRIGVYGRSIGSAVALYLATERPIRTVILDSPFSSGREMAEHHYSFLPLALMRLSLDNLSRAEQLTVPLLIFHGTEDRIAPIEMGRAVAQAGRADSIIELVGAGHNDTYAVGGDMYVRHFLQFLDTNLRHP